MSHKLFVKILNPSSQITASFILMSKVYGQ